MESNTRLDNIIERYRNSGLEQEIDHSKFYLYSIVTHSTAIEGSTITEVENQLLFDEGIVPAGKSIVEQFMNLDLRDAYDRWLEWAQGNIVFSADILRQMSASVMCHTGSVYNTVLGDFDLARGDFRLVNVRAGANGRSYMSFQKIPDRVNEFCQWLNDMLANVDRTDVSAVYALSFAAHYRLVTIHPWVDGNGRTTRLVMNIIQSHLGVPMSKVLKKDKAAYIQALIDSREAEDEQIFIACMIDLLCADLEHQIMMATADDKDNITDNVTENVVNVTDNITDTQRRILDILRGNPQISQSEIATMIGIHRVNVNRNIQHLVALGILRREGSDRKGRWIIING